MQLTSLVRCGTQLALHGQLFPTSTIHIWQLRQSARLDCTQQPHRPTTSLGCLFLPRRGGPTGDQTARAMVSCQSLPYSRVGPHVYWTSEASPSHAGCCLLVKQIQWLPLQPSIDGVHVSRHSVKCQFNQHPLHVISRFKFTGDVVFEGMA